MRRVRRRQTIKTRINKHDPAIRIADEIVDIEVAGGVSDARDEQPVVAFVQFTGAEDVLESPELKLRTHPERLAVAEEPHAAVERPLEDGECPRSVPPEEE